MLTDFFDTMGTVTGVAAEAGLANEDGSVPGVGRVLLVDCVAAVVGGLGGVSLEHDLHRERGGRRRGRPDRLRLGRHRRPVPARDPPRAARGIIPTVATAPALVLVGYLMFTQVKDIDVADVEDGIPALLTMILMPLTYDITVGIGAGFISWVLIKVVARQGRARSTR